MSHRYTFAAGTLTAALILLAATALANPAPEGLLWSDDIDSGAPGWTTVDLTAERVPHFHTSSMNVFDGGISWYCGDEDLTADGGYGNIWEDYLYLPAIDVDVPVRELSWGALKALYRDGEAASPTISEGVGAAAGAPGGDDGAAAAAERTSSVPVLTYAYRYDCEPGYDFARVQIMSVGVWEPVVAPYDGSSGGWHDMGAYGIDLSAYGSPLELRFAFTSDGACSDEDGYYDSDGGGFSVDNVRVYDFMTGTTLFYDDVESGGLCTPGVPAPGGDFWHVADRPCPAYSDPYCWWCGDDADEAVVPPDLIDALMTPVIDVPAGWTQPCTLACLTHAEVPTECGDWWAEAVSPDAGVTWYETCAWWGDFGECDGWMSTPYYGISLTERVGSCEGKELVYRWVMHTDGDGCGPGAAGTAGVFIDNVYVWSGRLWTSPFTGGDRGEPKLHELSQVR